MLKQILTEGERYVMTMFSVLSFKEQGIYDGINNIGSIVVRFLFRPVEDSLYFYFTQCVRRDEEISNQNPVSSFLNFLSYMVSKTKVLLFFNYCIF